MKIHLIKPNIGRLEHSLFADEARMEPLQLGVLAALTPADVEVHLYDDRVEPIPYDDHVDLVAITAQIFTARRAYEISAEYRKRGIPVIIGGIHATMMPEEAAQYADSVYMGDAEFRWAEVIEDVRHGQLKPLYRAAVGIPHPDILPRRDLFDGKDYLPLTLLQFSRGCPYRCEFCAISVYFDKRDYCRSMSETVREIKSQKRRYLFFVDDNLLANHQAAKALFRALIPLDIRWVSQGSLDMTEDRELMRLMVESGCLGNVIGFESIDPRNLQLMGKTPNLTAGFDRYRRQIDVLREYGLQTWAAFTIGHDYDTCESIEQTLNFALENRFTFAAFNILMPYPKTPLYKRLQAEGRLLFDDTWWLHPEYRFNHAAFQPKHMSPDELTDIGFHCRKTFNSIPNIVRRALDPKTNMRSLFRFALFASYSRLFRQETFKKQGMRLGMS